MIDSNKLSAERLHQASLLGAKAYQQHRSTDLIAEIPLKQKLQDEADLIHKKTQSKIEKVITLGRHQVYQPKNPSKSKQGENKLIQVNLTRNAPDNVVPLKHVVKSLERQ